MREDPSPDPSRWPTPEEWREWFLSQSPERQLEASVQALRSAEEAHRCLVRGHQYLIDEIHHLRQRVADLTLALHDTPTAEG